MKKAEVAIVARKGTGGRKLVPKIELRFIEKPERERKRSLSPHVQRDPQPKEQEYSKISSVVVTKNDFGIGELAEEFATLAAWTPPPTPASPASTSDTSNGHALSQDSGGVFPKKAIPDPIATTALNSILTALLHSNLPANHFDPGLTTNGLSVAEGCPQNISVQVLAPTAPNTNCAPASLSTDNNRFLSPSTTVSSSSSGLVPLFKAPMLRRSRLVRRYQYWCRVLEMRRRRPMCRFCYERYVHMCLDSHQTIPSAYDRGMWHGHSMKERGLVTCPHLWATVCPHCGASKQYAHTEDYCPLVRRNFLFPQVNNRNFHRDTPPANF